MSKEDLDSHDFVVGILNHLSPVDRSDVENSYANRADELQTDLDKLKLVAYYYKTVSPDNDYVKGYIEGIEELYKIGADNITKLTETECSNNLDNM